MLQPAPNVGLDYFPDEVCQESYQQESADSADPKQEVRGQLRRVDFFLVHVGQPAFRPRLPGGVAGAGGISDAT